MSTLLGLSQPHTERLAGMGDYRIDSSLASLCNIWSPEAVRQKPLMFAGLAIVTAMWLAATLIVQLRTRMRQRDTPPSTPIIEKHSQAKATEREPGGTAEPNAHPASTNVFVLR